MRHSCVDSGLALQREGWPVDDTKLVWAMNNTKGDVSKKTK